MTVMGTKEGRHGTRCKQESDNKKVPRQVILATWYHAGNIGDLPPIGFGFLKLTIVGLST